MITLKPGWVLSSIGELSSYVQRGKSPKYTNYSELPVINQRCIRWNKLETQHLKFIHPDQIATWDAARYIRAGDILWNSTGTGTVGRAYLVSEADCATPKVVDSHVTIVRSCNQVDPRYLFNWIKGPLVQQKIEEMCDGTTNQIELSGRAISETEIPIAPFNEQNRIADKLDAVLTKVDACRDRLDRIPFILKRFRQSVLASAISGKLSEEWRLNREDKQSDYYSVEIKEPYSHLVLAPSSWKRYALGDVVDFIGGSQPPKSTFSDKDGLDVIRLIQIRDYKSDKHLTYIPKNLAKRFCSKTDVMIGRYGPPIFQILRGLEGAYNVALMKAEPKNPELDLEYLYYFLKVDVLLKYVEGASDRTAGQDGVRKELLFPYPIFLPSMEEQHEIVRRVETLFACADRLEARYTTARAQVEKLTPALLSKAFRGELVPQDPNDEPASELLARIAAAKPVPSTKKSPKQASGLKNP